MTELAEMAMRRSRGVQARHRRLTVFSAILCPLLGPEDGIFPSGHEAPDALRIRTEGRGTLGGLQNSQAPAGAGPGEDQVSSGSQGFGSPAGGLGDGRLMPNGRREALPILFEEKPHHFLRGESVQLPARRVAGLRRQAAPLVGGLRCLFGLGLSGFWGLLHGLVPSPSERSSSVPVTPGSTRRIYTEAGDLFRPILEAPLASSPSFLALSRLGRGRRGVRAPNGQAFMLQSAASNFCCRAPGKSFHMNPPEHPPATPSGILSPEQALAAAREILPWMIEIRRDLHQHPELGLEEHRTAARVQAFLDELEIPYASGIGGTGVVGTLEGPEPGKAVALRAGSRCAAPRRRQGRSLQIQDSRQDARLRP